MDLNQISKKILPLAVPMTLIQLITTASGFLCMAMLAHLGKDVLAASALIFSTQMPTMVIGMSILFSVSLLVWHAFGAKNYPLIGNFVQQGWTLGILISIPTMIIFLNMGKILILFGQSIVLSHLVQNFYNGYLWAVVPTFLLISNQQFCFGINKQKLVVLSSSLSVVVLLLISYLLIFGKLGLPRLGVAGLGYAMSAQVWFAFLFMTIWFCCDKHFKNFNLFSYRVHKNWNYLLQMLKVGWPISLQMGGELLSFFANTIMIGWLGIIALAAGQVVTQYSILSIIPFFSLSQAIGILVGQACGRKQYSEIKNLGYASVGLGVIMTLAVAVILVGFPKNLAALYLDVANPSNQEILHLIIVLFVIIAVSQIFDAVRNILIGAARGLLDTKFPMLISLLVIWLIGIPLSYLLAFNLHFGVPGIFLGSAIGMLIGALVMLYRWHALTKNISMDPRFRGDDEEKNINKITS